MAHPFARWSARRREDREFQAEMIDFYSRLPADLQSQLRHQYEREARTLGTLAYHNRREQTRPWLVLWILLVVVPGVVLGILAAGQSLTGFSNLLFR